MMSAATLLQEMEGRSSDVSTRGAEKTAIARDFGAASATYNPAARLQRYMGNVMLERILSCAEMNSDGVPVTLDLGCGTGWFTGAIADQAGAQRAIGLDLSPGMLEYARAANKTSIEWLAADAEAIPLPDHSVDLIFSNLMIQWAENPAQVLRECQRILRPGGQLLVSTLLDGTLRELKEAWYSADPDHQHVNRFETESDFRQLAGNVLPAARVDTETVQLDYASPMALLAELKSIGAGFKGGERRISATSPGRLKSMCRHYPRHTGSSGETHVIASYEAAWLSYSSPA